MAKNLNRCEFIGRLGREPETRFLDSGTAICSFSIASNSTPRKEGDRTVYDAEWVNVVAWGKLAEICGKYLDKGSKVYVCGRLQTRSWEDKEGTTRYKTEVVIEEMEMLDSKRGDNADDEEYQPAPSKPVQRQQQQSRPAPRKSYVDEETLPF